MKLKIRDARKEDLPQIKRLIDTCISRDFYSLEDLEGMLCREDDLLYVTVDMEKEEKVVSYFYAFLAPLDEALHVLHVTEKPKELQKYPESERVGVYKTSSTDPAYRNQGVFSSFMADLQPVLRSKGAKLIINTALRPMGRDIPILNILRSTGFVPLQTLHSPWVKTKGYCPYCKKDYCICDAVLYVREFEAKGDKESHG